MIVAVKTGSYTLRPGLVVLTVTCPECGAYSPGSDQTPTYCKHFVRFNPRYRFAEFDVSPEVAARVGKPDKKSKRSKVSRR